MVNICNKWAPIFLILLVSSCGNSAGYRKPELAPVTGTVSWKGEPLSHGMIVFYPPSGRSAQGRIKNGEILDVYTFVPGDGAPVGELKVEITSNDPKPGDPSGMSVTSQIPVKYTRVASSQLTATVKPSRTNTLTFQLEE